MKEIKKYFHPLRQRWRLDFPKYVQKSFRQSLKIGNQKKINNNNGNDKRQYHIANILLRGLFEPDLSLFDVTYFSLLYDQFWLLGFFDMVLPR